MSIATVAPRNEEEQSVLREGGVQLTSLSTLLSHHRFLFLYPDTLVVSKQKGVGTFKTKEKVSVDSVWVSPTGGSPDSFLIGWPLRNFLVHFPNRREKEEWFSLLSSLISSRLRPLSTTIMMSILVRGRKQIIRRTIHNGKRAGEVIVETQKELGLPSASYDLRIQIGDSSPKILQGPENVYCVIMHEIEKSGVRLSESHRSSLDTCAVVSAKLLLSHLRTSRPSPQEILASLKRRLSRSEAKSLFGRPLEGRTPPQPVLSIIDHLRMHSCNTEGLFRKSPKHSTAKELRSELERGLVPDYNKYNAHVLAATLKDYLRSIPNKLLLNGNYQLWMRDVVEESEMHKKVQSTRALLSLLPPSHSILLLNLLTLLAKVASSSESLMTSSSLAVCLAPSFLDCSDPTSSKRVPDLIQFLIQHAAQVEVVPSFSSPSPSPPLHSVDLNANEVFTAYKGLGLTECVEVPSSFVIEECVSACSLLSPLSPPPLPPRSPSDVPPSTPSFRSKTLRGEAALQNTPRSPCLKRIHFNAHLLRGGGPSRPNPLLSDSDDEDDNTHNTWRPFSRCTVDVPRKTSLDNHRGEDRASTALDNSPRTHSNEMARSRETASVYRPEPPRPTVSRTVVARPELLPTEVVEAVNRKPSDGVPPESPRVDPPSLRVRDEKPTVQVLPFRAKEREDNAMSTDEDSKECKVVRSLSQRGPAGECAGRSARGELARTASVITDRARRPAHRTEPLCVGLESLEINWSVAQLKRVFQSAKAPEIHTHFGQ